MKLKNVHHPKEIKASMKNMGLDFVFYATDIEMLSFVIGGEPIVCRA